jgi:hypothetical protein
LHDLYTKQGYPIYRLIFLKAFLIEKLQSSKHKFYSFPAPKIFLKYYKITNKKEIFTPVREVSKVRLIQVAVDYPYPTQQPVKKLCPFGR